MGEEFKGKLIKLIKNEPALIIEDGKRHLVLGDLHIGFEKGLSLKGIKIPSQTDKLAKKIIELIRKNSVSSLIILGDIKHEFVTIKPYEWFDIPKFFEEILKEGIEVKVTLGNHDGGLDALLPPKVKLFKKITKSFSFGKITFLHGHTWIGKEALNSHYIMMGHHHFTYRFKDTHKREPVWVFARWSRYKLSKILKVQESSIGDPTIIIFPAFNQILSGYCINCERNEERELNPLFRERLIDRRRSEIFSLDYSYLRSFANLPYPS
ncbi:MAG: metallophosphoesterase [Nitrososphaerales archaeon]